MDYWFENLRIVICVVKPLGEGETFTKEVPSTDGMKLSV